MDILENSGKKEATKNLSRKKVSFEKVQKMSCQCQQLGVTKPPIFFQDHINTVTFVPKTWLLASIEASQKLKRCKISFSIQRCFLLQSTSKPRIFHMRIFTEICGEKLQQQKEKALKNFPFCCYF